MNRPIEYKGYEIRTVGCCGDFMYRVSRHNLFKESEFQTIEQAREYIDSCEITNSQS